ncbi:hypothetical protein [Geminocystis sp. NIES-3709]|uniref:hypothetical protein n=1 Tax=Geminocystis sp. NIES-3709 TaxID=1617448 RepID=UPI0005FC9DBF|nr:hypothetical protein [Geminocystis sp. NIES-3709]BAQ67141.1 hypothetical protein GM3709_3906 [Geminocystis sp. NIES-3709]
MKIFSYLFIVFIAVLFIFLSPNNALAGNITTITVDVEKTKAGEQNWDVKGGAPDIALCISHSLVGTLCLPEGDDIDLLRLAECKDSYHCRFSVETPDRNFKLSVIDVDFLLNDLIGTGHCGRRQTCTVGQAIVKVD